VRTSLALVVAAGLVASLAGCSVQLPWSSSCEITPDGAATALVTVSGDFGEEPMVQMPTPVRTTETQVQRVIAGEGDGIIEGQQAVISYQIYNGRTGELVGYQGWGQSDAIPVVVSQDLAIHGLYSALVCAPVGARIVSVISPQDAFQEAGGNASAGVEADDSLVLVADIESAYLPRANGFSLLPESGLPLISLAPSGQPGMTTPNFPAPTQLRISTLKQGGGVEVNDGDSVVAHYTGWLFDDGSVFDSSWGKGPATFAVGDGSTVPGFEQALQGAQVGDQIIAIIPPEQGYGAEGNGTTIPADATLVFVIDVLGVVGE
jgi:peptidylprolyl isomerase